MNNQVSNKKVEVPKGVSMNEKDYLASTLSCLKEMTKNYAVALTEASCEHLYEVYNTMFQRYSQLQREVYELMFQNGWYVLERSETQKINQKKET